MEKTRCVPVSFSGADLHANAKVNGIRGRGFTVNGCFVLGLDGHGPGIFAKVLEFARRARLYEVQITTLTAFPGTPLYERLLKEGRIVERRRWDLCTLFDVNYRPARMTAEELKEGLYCLGARLYSAEAVEERRAGFYRQWKEFRRGQ